MYETATIYVVLTKRFFFSITEKKIRSKTARSWYGSVTSIYEMKYVVAHDDDVKFLYCFESKFSSRITFTNFVKIEI